MKFASLMTADCVSYCFISNITEHVFWLSMFKAFFIDLNDNTLNTLF